MSWFQATPEQVREFEDKGYLVVKGLLQPEEVELLGKIARADKQLAETASLRTDAAGGQAKLSLSNEIGDDLYGAIVRSERLVQPMTAMLGGEVYHYHHKMNMKEPYVGGAWEWHQDYGYWYKAGCLFPHMASCMIAVDKATKENGCLQVIEGSHHCGRIEHGITGDQTGADQARVDALLERLPLIYCEMEAGDGLFFHSNLLHRSEQNCSPDPRWVLICCYNRMDNDAYSEETRWHAKAEPLAVLPDEQVVEVGRRQWAELQAQLGENQPA